MNNFCNTSNVKPVKISELASYSSLKSNDLILIVENNGLNLYSRKTTFSDFVSSILSLTSSLSGNVIGNLTGSLYGNVSGSLTGSIKGNFTGILKATGSLIGIPFKTRDQELISFDGTSSYSVTSSHAVSSLFSKNTFSSSYSLSSSFGFTDYSLNSISSSFCNSSSFTYKSLISSHSLNSNRSANARYSQYSINCEITDSSSYSLYSSVNKTSSYSIKSDLAKIAKISNFASSSLVALTASYTINPPPADFEMIYFSTYSGNSNYTPLFSQELQLFSQTGRKTWTKVTLDKIYQDICGVTINGGKLPPNVEYVYLTFIVSGGETQSGVLLYSPNPYDSNQPTFYLNWTDMGAKEGGVFNEIAFDDTTDIFHAILPIKPGITGSFYYTTQYAGGGFGVSCWLMGFVKPQECD